MASHVTHDVTIEVEQLLDALQREWADAVALVRRWSDVDDVEQADFVVEWLLTIDRLIRVRALEQQRRLSDAQLRRLHALRAFIRLHESELAQALGAGNVMPAQRRG